MPAHTEFTPLKSSCAQELHLLVLMKKGKVFIMVLFVGFVFFVGWFCFGWFLFNKGRGGIATFL